MELEHYRQLINSYLEKLIPAEDAAPVPIYRAMRYSLFAGGKRLRPALVFLAGETLGADVEELLPAAASVEMIHTYSLIHDDLPSMDNDDFRRGKPTNHRVFGEAIAILAGDALLTAGLEILSNAHYEPETRCRLISLLTRAAGTQGMIGGQVLDILGEAKTLDRVDLEMIHAMKTAALLGYCATAPAVILKKGPEVERAFSQYGEAVGLAFQIVDDILDVEGTTQSLGKTAGKDQHAGKATYPAILGLQESRKLAADLMQAAAAAVANFDRNQYLISFAEYILNRKH
ncbi:polyprenyl synthetase family protein [bacterium]|nr:polyprenyl synthetase family protein [bacterium]MCI0606787.1 polyprenyl synthetase family protein [bacterium]